MQFHVPSFAADGGQQVGCMYCGPGSLPNPYRHGLSPNLASSSYYPQSECHVILPRWAMVPSWHILSMGGSRNLKETDCMPWIDHVNTLPYIVTFEALRLCPFALP